MEVACALEGLSHCLAVCHAQAQHARAAKGAVTAAEETRQRLERYAACALVAAGFLLEAQVLSQAVKRACTCLGVVPANSSFGCRLCKCQPCLPARGR